MVTDDTGSRDRSAAPLRLPLLDNAVLRSFVTIAETGSFSRAARQLFRTPAALSMQIKRLEETVQRPLFVREARQVRLTPEGEMLLGYGRRMLQLNEEAVSQFLAPTLEGRLRLGTPDDAGTRMLPRILSQFARSYPAVQVDVVGGRSVDLRARLERDELDLALITLGAGDREPSHAEIVYSEPLVWAGHEGGVAIQRSPLPISLANRGCPWRAMAVAALERANIRYHVAYTSEHTAGQEAVVAADLAVAPLPLSLLSPPLQRLDEDHGLPELGDYRVALLRRPHISSVADVFAQEVIDAFRAIGSHP